MGSGLSLNGSSLHHTPSNRMHPTCTSQSSPPHSASPLKRVVETFPAEPQPLQSQPVRAQTGPHSPQRRGRVGHRLAGVRGHLRQKGWRVTNLGCGGDVGGGANGRGTNGRDNGSVKHGEDVRCDKREGNAWGVTRWVGMGARLYPSPHAVGALPIASLTPPRIGASPRGATSARRRRSAVGVEHTAHPLVARGGGTGCREARRRPRHLRSKSSRVTNGHTHRV